jgi:hypothetical protein
MMADFSFIDDIVNMESEIFTLEYLKQEIVSFFELMGSKSAWEDPERMSIGLKAILMQYLNCKEDTTSVETIIQALCNEYDRRLAYIMTK